MYNVFVCDDNVPFMQVMEILLNKYAEVYDVTVKGFSDGRELLEYCCEHKCDIIYMDIEVGKENGMSLARTIKIMNPRALIIYISAYDTYYVDMVQAEPFRFIHKDAIDILRFEKELADTLDAALRRLNGKELWSFVFDRKRYYVELGKIEYFYSMYRKVHIVGDVGEAPDYFYGKIDNVQKELGRINGNFVRISKSYIVNMKYIIWDGKNRIRVGNKSFSVTMKYKEDFKRRYLEYWNVII